MIGIYHLISKNNLGFPIQKNASPRCQSEQISYGSIPNDMARFVSSSRGARVYHPAFNENSAIIIKAVKVSMYGGRGLREGMDIDTESGLLPSPAFVSLSVGNNYAEQVYNNFAFHVGHYDEWAELNLYVAPNGEKKYFRLQSLLVNYDTANIQDSFIGLNVCPQVELLIECAGMYGDFGGGDLL